MSSATTATRPRRSGWTTAPSERPAVRSALEVERKYDVDPDTAVPDLDGLDGIARVTSPDVAELHAHYYDTADLRLRAAATTLRRRTGGSDAGWHLELPAGADREEIAVDLAEGDGDRVPAALHALVRARVRRAPLAPVAVLATRRTVRHLVDARGRVLAEVADDEVTARTLPDGEEQRWREWEVELVGGPRALLDAVQDRLLAGGAVPSRSSSKLGRVLAAPPGSTCAPAAPGTAGALVAAHLAEQVGELLDRDPQARRDVPDSVHKMRVATRRLRSALATFRPLLDRERTDPLRDELRWLASVLGAARDAEVLQARLLALVAAEPDDLVLGDVVGQVRSTMSARHRQAHEALLRALDGDRYLGLLDRLEALAADPPLRRAARGAARPALARAVRRGWHRLDDALTLAARAPRGQEQEARLHEVRKLAKRVRYACEAVEPAFGRRAKRTARAVTALQESLGDLQDGVVTRAALRELGAAASAAGRNGFTFGRLHALEQARAEAAVAAFPAASRAVRGTRLRRWSA